MKEPDDILKEIRSLLGEDIEKIEKEELPIKEAGKEEPKISIEGGEGIEKLLSDIEKELEPKEEISQESGVRSLESGVWSQESEEGEIPEPLAKSQEPSEEAPSFELGEEEISQESEETPSFEIFPPEHQDIKAPEHQEIEEETPLLEPEEEEEKIPQEELVQLEQEPKFEAPSDQIEEEISQESGVRSLKSGVKSQESEEGETPEPLAESQEPSEETFSFELEEEKISQEEEIKSQEPEEIPSVELETPEHQEIGEETPLLEPEEEEEKIPQEELVQLEQEPKFEAPSEQIEEEISQEEKIRSQESEEGETPEPLAESQEPSEETPSFEPEKEEVKEEKTPDYQSQELEEEEEAEEKETPDYQSPITDYQSLELENKAPNKEQEEIGALLKEDVKKKPAPIPKKPIKINKNLIFIPILTLLILGIIGFFGFFHIYPKKKLESAISDIEKGKIREGEEMFNKWINFVFLKNQKMPFYHQLIEAYLSINDYHKASSIFWKAFKVDPNNQNTHNYILSSTLKREGWEKAKETAEKILSKDSRSIPAYLILSRYFSKEGEIKKAISYLENGALKASPSNLSVISLLQILYFQNKQYDKTISLHRFLIDHLKNKPLNPEIVTKAAGYFIEKEKLNIGKPPLEEILRAFPKNIEARYLLALSWVMEGNKEKAMEELKIVLKNESRSLKGWDEGYPPAYNLLGEILRDKGKYIDALEAFSNAILKDPHFGKAHYNLADTAFHNLNDYSTSIKGYEDARKNGYTHPQLSYNLGLSYYLKGKYEKARNEFENLDKDKTVLYNIACVDCRLKNFNRAKSEFKEVESLCKERLKEKISPQEEKGLYLFLSNIYNNLGLISEVSGFSQEAQEKYWDAINTAKLSDFEHKEAFSNLTNLFNGRKNSLFSLSDKMDKEYVVQK